VSQERIRFPIQPKDRRRSAVSNKDADVPGEQYKGGKTKKDPDKPTVPPHRRHERGDKHSEE
jgi:hypothetical protein